MKKSILAILVVLLLVGLFAFSAFGEETTVTFAPYTDADGIRQYCACGNMFVADADGTVEYVNGEDGCKNVKDESGNVIDGCDGTLIKWSPRNTTLSSSAESAYKVAEDGTVSGMAFYLTKDIKSGSQQFGTDAGNYYLDLNGYSFTRNDARVITPQTGVNLYITDTSAEKDGYIACVDTNDSPYTGQGPTVWFRYAGCSLTLFEGTIDGTQEATSHSTGGTAICNTNNNKISQFGGTIKSGTSTTSRGGFMVSAGTYNLYDGQVIGGTAINGGTLYVGSTATVNIYDGTITGGTSTNAGGCIYNIGTINVMGGSITGGSTTKNGACIYSNGTLKISDGIITGGSTTADGGTIYSQKVLEITGGEILGGNAKNGGNIYSSGATFTVSGGKIHSGTASNNGGNIWTSNMELSGGEIYNGTATGNPVYETSKYNTMNVGVGGNLYMGGGGDLTMTGGNVYNGSINGNTGGNIFVYGQTGSGDTLNTSVISITGGRIWGGAVNADGDAKGTTALNALADQQGGSIYFYTKGEYTIGGDVVIGKDAEGNTAGGTAYNGGNIYVTSACTLNITGGTIHGGNATSNGGNIYSTGTVNITGGTISEGKAGGEGGNVLNFSGHTMTMSGGTITGGKANNGGNVLNGGTFNMTGGVIKDGTASTRGGNVQSFRGNSGTFTMSGDALVSGGTASYGGNFFLGGALNNSAGNADKRWGTLIVNGGTISGGQATGAYDEDNCVKGNGGNIYVHERGCAQINGGVVENGTANGRGGNICVGDYPTAKLEITAGEIKNGIADVSGGNIHAYAGVTSKPDDADYGQGYVTIAGATLTGGESVLGGSISLAADATVTGCTMSGGNASGNGGGFFINGGGHLVLTDSGIENVTSGQNGGAIFAYLDSQVELNNVTISGSSAAEKGGAIFNAGTMTVTGGSITSGQGAVGGNIYTKDSLTLSNVTIDDGVANGGITVAEDGTVSGGDKTYGGGNIYMEAGELNIQDGTTISDGTTWFANGGNIYADKGTINMTGGTISGGDSKTNNKNTSNDQMHGGNVALIGAATFNISGGTVTGGYAHEGGNFRVSNQSTLNISGNALITLGSASAGGNINTYGVVNMSGGTISDGTATGNGGNVQCFRSTTTRNSVFTMTGGNITGGTANRGGNVFVSGTGGKTGYFVLESGTITGGTANPGNDLFVNNLGNATVKGGTVNDIYVISNATDVGGILTLAGNPAIATLFVDNDNNLTVDASDLACTNKIAVSVTEVGSFANSSVDTSACFSCEAEYEVCYDAAAQKLYVRYPVVQDVYVSASGNDLAAGNEANPVQTFARALNIVADGGTIHLVGVVDVSGWTAHDKSITVTGGEMNVTKGNPFYIRDSVHFKNMTMRFSTVTADTNDTAGKHRVYALGNKVIIDEDVTVKYGADGSGVTGQYVYLFGGGNDSNVVSSTDLTVLAGTWGRIFGGSNGSDISGDVHLTVGGKVNEGVDYVSHDYSAHYLILGGSSGGDIGGTVYMNVTGGTHTSTHGGSNGTCSIGAVEMHVTGGEGMAVYGGGRGGVNTIGTANLYYEGGNYEQVFGGGLNSLEGTINLYVTGGTISRRLYGGSYNDTSGLSFSSDYMVTGNINLYIGSGANITLDYNDNDLSIYGHSRRKATASDAELSRIIFLDKAAYDKYYGSLKYNDLGMSLLMGGVTAADYVCYLGWSANDETDVITSGAVEVEDHASNALDMESQTATLTLSEGPYIYEGQAVTPASVVYSDNWNSGDAILTYANNGAKGTATVTMTVNGYTVSKVFAVQTYTAQTVIGDAVTNYLSLQEAVNNAAGGYVKLLASYEGAITVSGNVTLDLAGYTLSNVTVSEGGSLKLMDSATDDFEGAYGSAVVTGNVETFVEVDGKTYLVVSRDGAYSAHRYEVKLTYVSLDPANDALGYKAQFNGDEVVRAHVTGFGFNMWVDGGSVKTYSKDGAFANGQVLTLRLKNIMAANGGEMGINANAFVIFDVDGRQKSCTDHSTSMKQVILTVNDSFDSYSDAQKAAVKALYDSYSAVMDAWFAETAENKIAAWKPEA